MGRVKWNGRKIRTVRKAEWNMKRERRGWDGGKQGKSWVCESRRVSE